MVSVAQPLGATGLGGRVLNVDHAGEHGAVNIYAGQILMARLTAPELVGELTEFRSHELRHREIFRLELQRRGRRRCRRYWLCGFGGLALGLIIWRSRWRGYASLIQAPSLRYQPLSPRSANTTTDRPCTREREPSGPAC
jgi:ubiquinone biosynthesis protein COQ7